MTAVAAVLTGDLIGSTPAGNDAVERAMAVLSDTAEDIAHWPDARPTRFTRHRGDGWQALVAPPARGLRAAVLFIARLRATADAPATRIAIGKGLVQSIGTTDLSDAHGEAFASSGRALELMGRGMRLNIGGSGFTPLHWGVVDLIDEITARWTPHQAEAMALALHPGQPTQAEVAARLGISTQAANYRLTGAGAGAIRRALHAWETTEEAG